MKNQLKRRQTRIRQRANRQGAAAVEFAMMAPVFFIIVFASFEMIRLNMIRNLVQDAAYFAARDAIVPGATEDEAEATARRVLAFMNTQGAQVQINNGGSLNSGSQSVTVEISVPVSENSFLFPQYSSDIVFSASATMLTERYHGYYHPD